MNATILLIHRISVSLFLLSYLIRLIGMLANISAIQNLYSQKFMRMLVDMVISTVFLLTGVYMLLQLPGSQITMMLILKVVAVLLSIPLAIVGFKKNKKALALLSVVLILASYGMAEMNHRKPPVNKTDLAAVSSADAIFKAANCSSCHGADGKSPVGGAKNLAESKLTEEEIVMTISKGRNAMPSYKSQLSEAQIGDVAKWVKSLQGSAASQPAE